MNILEFVLAFAALVLLSLLVYTNKIQRFKITWNDARFPSIEFTVAEVKSEFPKLFKDMMRNVEDFRNHMRKPKYDPGIVEEILEHEQFQLPESFQRRSPLHRALRSLRTAGLIRPHGGGEWQKKKTVQKTLLCRKLLEDLGENRQELWRPSAGLIDDETD